MSKFLTQVFSTPLKTKRSIGLVLSMVVALLPIGNIIRIIATTGANNLSNDYTSWVWMVDQIFSGTYEWSNFFLNTVRAGHAMIWTTLFHLVMAWISDWNAYSELYVGIGLFVVRLVLLIDIFTFEYRKQWLLIWPLISALAFSVSQINVFTFGDSSFQMGICQFGWVLGLWGLVRFPDRWLGIGLMALGGNLASWSWSGGIWTWGLFLLIMIIKGNRSRLHYFFWFTATLVTAWPYVFYMFIQPSPRALTNSSYLNLFNWKVVLNLIGWPLTNFSGFSGVPVSISEWIGISGIVIILIGVLLILLRGYIFPSVITALATICFGLLSLWQISIFRTSVSSWYTTPAMVIWIGLAGLVYQILCAKKQSSPITTKIGIFADHLIPWWGGYTILFISIAYLASNLNYEDKVLYMYSRSPVSAACMLHYLDSPTYCEGYVFQWGVGQPEILSNFSKPLARQGWSVFEPHQIWTLQGEFILNSVKLNEEPDSSRIIWVENRSNKPVAFSSYKHLNLFLETPNSVEWAVKIPKNISNATFHSAVAIDVISQKERISGSVFGGMVDIYVKHDSDPPFLAYRNIIVFSKHGWNPVRISLSDYAGQSIVIKLGLSSKNPIRKVAGYFSYPYIDLNINESNILTLMQEIKPINTDLSFDFPAKTPSDLVLSDLSAWQFVNMAPSENKTSWKIENDPQMIYKNDLNVCLADYSHFYIHLAVSPEIKQRAIQVFFLLNDQDSFSDSLSVFIPLLADGEMHAYSYDLKLLQLGHNSRVKGLRIDPVYFPAPSGKNEVQVDEVKFISKNLARSLCNE